MEESRVVEEAMDGERDSDLDNTYEPGDPW